MAEKKYIELQKALNVCEMHYQHCLEMHDWSGDTTADNIMRDIETLPTSDVVEVVRCKDCRYAKPVTHRGEVMEDIFKCTYIKMSTNLFDIDYCRYGKKKGGAE